MCCRRVSETGRTWVGAQNSRLHIAGLCTLWWSLFCLLVLLFPHLASRVAPQNSEMRGVVVGHQQEAHFHQDCCSAQQLETELKPVWGYCPRRGESSLFPVPRSRCFLCIMPSNYKVSQISPDLMKNQLIQNELRSLETRERTEEGVGLSLLVAGCN